MADIKTLIEENYDAIVSAIKEADYDAMTTHGNSQTSIYIWSDGTIETLYECAGGNSSLVPRDNEDRELFYLTCRSAQGFNVFDFDNESELEQLIEYDPTGVAEMSEKYCMTLADKEDYDENDLVDYIEENSDIVFKFTEYAVENIIFNTDYDEIMNWIIRDCEIWYCD